MPGKPWTTREVRLLVDNAGRMPVRDLCRLLGRTEEAVTQQVKRMSRMGMRVSLRYVEPARSMTCPACGRRSYTAWDTGICRPCQLRRRIAATEGAIAELMSRLPAADRETYRRTESSRGPVRTDPMPRRRRRANASPSQEARDEEDHARAMELWEADRLHRQLRAAQRRKERIERKLRG